MILKKTYYFLLIQIGLIKNKNLLKKKFISLFEYNLRKSFLKQNNFFGVTDFYQSYPP
jgi:hypothetical protein